MAFPPYVHSVIPESDPAYWPIQQQGVNECGVTAPANALNILTGLPRFDKDRFRKQASILFQRRLGGSPSPVTGWLIKRQGYGTHFGALRGADREIVLRDLIDRGVPVVIELGANKIGPWTIFGLHSVVLVGYSERYTDAAGRSHQEYYLADAQYPADWSTFGLHTNDADRDGDGKPEPFPGNRTLERDQLLADYPTGIYFPIFRTQAEHDAWYRTHIRRAQQSLVGRLVAALITGSPDVWRAG
jgi:hypothetical protein